MSANISLNVCSIRELYMNIERRLDSFTYVSIRQDGERNSIKCSPADVLYTLLCKFWQCLSYKSKVKVFVTVTK